MRQILYWMLVLAAVLPANFAAAQERVYVSTDKYCYVAGEDVWCSVHCIDSSDGGYSLESSVAFLEFHSRKGIEATIKIPLIEGRGCGRLQIPLDFATGNYSIVAYTRAYGGDSKGEFDGKIVTIFNTLTSEKVADGVEVVENVGELASKVWDAPVAHRKLAIKLPGAGAWSGSVPVVLENLADKNMQLSVSVYHEDEIARLLGPGGYNGNTLLQRTGNFEHTSTLDYAGEVIRARIVPKVKSEGNSGTPKGYVYMSAIGNTDDLYISNVDSLGYVTYLTNNISGKRDLVFEVVDGSMGAYNVEIVDPVYRHTPAQIPVLKISEGMEELNALLGL